MNDEMLLTALDLLERQIWHCIDFDKRMKLRGQLRDTYNQLGLDVRVTKVGYPCKVYASETNAQGVADLEQVVAWYER